MLDRLSKPPTLGLIADITDKAQAATIDRVAQIASFLHECDTEQSDRFLRHVMAGAAGLLRKSHGTARVKYALALIEHCHAVLDDAAARERAR